MINELEVLKQFSNALQTIHIVMETVNMIIPAILFRRLDAEVILLRVYQPLSEEKLILCFQQTFKKKEEYTNYVSRRTHKHGLVLLETAILCFSVRELIFQVQI